MTEIVKKICMCGDPSVGKTSLVKRFVTGRYEEKYLSTLGTVISKKSVRATKNKCNVTMMLWDVSGQREFKRIHTAAFKNAKGCFAVCDITRPETSANLQGWITSLKEFAGPDVPIAVLANKSDLTEDKKKDFSLLSESLKHLDVPIILTSAKTGDNVEAAFKEMANYVSGNFADSMIDEVPGEITQNGVPNSFDSSAVLLDYVMMRFCAALGDHELGMHIVRKQITDEGVDFHNITKKEIKKLTDDLLHILTEARGTEVSKNLRFELIKAFDRCKGC